MKKHDFIRNVSQAIFNKRCELFIGSGVSSASRAPSWVSILEPLASSIGLDITEEDDLPMVAQYIVNNNSGNRNRIRNRIIDAIERDYEINDNHRAIALMNIETIWTTNYDNLIEKASNNSQTHVIATDEDFIRPDSVNKLKIIKLHGDIYRGANQVIITQEDYDTIHVKKNLLMNHLRDSFTKKSILFLGYSYRDPDIRTVMVEAMHLLHNNTQEHYIILRKPKKLSSHIDEDFTKTIREFELWLGELNRIGINELVIDEYDELPDILNEISLNSRGNTVYISGSHETTHSDIAKEIARRLVGDDKTIMLYGQSVGVGEIAFSEFYAKSIQSQVDIINRIRIYPNPYSINPGFSSQPELVEELKRHRKPIFATTKLVIFFAGGLGTSTEFELAKEQHCAYLPIITSKNDYGNDLIMRIIDNLKSDKVMCARIPEYCKILESGIIPDMDDIWRAIERVIHHEEQN